MTDTKRQGGSGRIAIAERWSVLRRGLIGLLDGRHVVVAEVEHLSELLTVVAQRPVDLAVVGDAADIDLPAAVESILGLDGAVAVVVLCEDISGGELTALLRTGARGVLSKSVADGDLLDGIDRALGGDRVIDQRFLPLLYVDAADSTADDTDDADDAPTGMLTRREHQVLVRLAQGETNRQIAEVLVVGESTVKTHLSHIYAKLEVDNRHRAVGRAFELGLLP